MALCEMNAHKMLVKAIDSLSVESIHPQMLDQNCWCDHCCKEELSVLSWFDAQLHHLEILPPWAADSPL